MTPQTIPAVTPGLAATAAPCVLAFDVGGTWVKYGIVDARGRLLCSDQLATRSEPDGRALLKRLLAVAAPLVARHAPAGIAFSTLGIIDAAEGRLVGAVEAIAGYFGQSPKEGFERAFGVPVVVENDGNCVALAEGWTGAAAGVRHYLALALGTGIGGGIVIDGRLYRGAHGAAGEWGNMLFAFNPSRVVIGGGITARGPAFLDELRAALRPRLRPEFHRMCDLALASAGSQAGLLGAARLWFTQHG